MKIQFKILTSFMVMVLIIVALIVFSILSMHIMSDSTRELVYIQEKEGLLADLQATIDRAVTSLGTYLVSGEKARRATFIQLVIFSKRQMVSLREAAANPVGDTLPGEVLERKKILELQTEMNTIDKGAQEILSLADKLEKDEGHKVVRDMVEMAKGYMEKRRVSGGGGEASSDLKALEDILGVNTRDVRKRIEEIERLSKTLSGSETRMRELAMQIAGAKEKALDAIGELRELSRRQGMAAVEMAAVAGRQAKKYTVVGAVLTLACGLVLAFSLSRSFSRPIVELERGASLIGKGDFDHRILIDTGDELEGLAAQFNTMAGRLKTFYSELEKRVRERTRDLELSNQQLKRLFNGITDGISVIDRNYTVLNANAGIASITGKADSDLVGGNCYRLYNSGEAPCPGCPVQETFEKGVASSAQIGWRIPGRRPRDIQIYIFPLLEEEGKVRCVIEYAKDVSERKALEQKLFQSAKLAAIGTLAAGVAHEIRNPLGIMKTSADMIRRNSRRGEQNHELAGFMMEEVERLDRVVTQLLDFAKPSMLNVKPCGINDVLDRALALVAPQYRLHDLRVVRKYGNDLPAIAGDKEQLCQVFLNLVINAAQAMEGGGTLTLETGHGDGETVWAGVSDTGGGIDPSILNNIFDPFFSTKEKGSGLGLTIGYRIVESHRGKMEVKSAPGKGTTVTVSIPTA